MKIGTIPACCLFLSLSVLVSCGRSAKSRQKDEKTLVEFISHHEAKVQPLDKAIQAARWSYDESGSREDLERLDSLKRQRSRLLHDERAFSYLEGLRTSGNIHDPYLQRQVECLYREYLPCQAPLALQDSILTLELSLKSQTLNRIVDPEMRHADDVLRNSTREKELQEAWQYVKSSGKEMGDALAVLVRLRNESARFLGFSNYFDMTLFLEEQDGVCLDSLFSELEQGTEAAYLSMRRRMDSIWFQGKVFDTASLRPWHLRGKFFRLGQRSYGTARDKYYQYVSMENVVMRFFSSINLDLSDVLGRSRVSGEMVFLPFLDCIDMDRNRDVRIIGHLSGTENDMQMLLAMVGEAAYYKNISNTLPYLLRAPASPALVCGVGSFFARMAAYPNWVLSMGIFSAGQACDIRGTTLRAMRQDQLFTCRWWMTVYYFEKRMYEDPDVDLDSLWQELFFRFLRIEPGKDRIGHSDWAMENYFSFHAVQAHNFVLGELWASQVLAHLCQDDPRMGRDSNPNVVGNGRMGTYFKKYVFQPGASLSWQELTVSCTGKPLSCEAFLHQFAE